MKTVRHLFVINPHSFFSPAELEAFVSQAAALPVRVDIHISRFPRDAVGAIRDYFEDSSEEARIYAVGGNGILYDCLNGLMCAGQDGKILASKAALATIPKGGINDAVRSFAVKAGFPASTAFKGKRQLFRLFQDLERQISAPVIEVDVIRCGDKYGFSECGIGGEAASILNYSKLSRKVRTFARASGTYRKSIHFLFYIGMLRAVFSDRTSKQEYEIEADAEVLSGDYLSINIANSPSLGGGFSIDPEAVNDDGFLNLALLKYPKNRFFKRFWYNKLKLLVLVIYNYIHGKGRRCPDVTLYRRIKKVSVRSPHPLIINIDGEIFFDSAVEVEVLPKAIRFAVPRLTEGDR